jgi:type IV pilus assembly protein PilM
MKQILLQNYYALSKYTKGQDIEEILVTGYGGSLKNLSEDLCKKLNKNPIFPENPIWKVSQGQLQDYAIPIGLALTALPKVKDQINFRQNEFAYSNPWKRYKKPIAIYMALCCLLAFFLYLFGETWIGYHEDKLKEEYGKILQVMNKSYHSFEEEYEQKNPTVKRFEDTIIPLKNLTRQELIERLNALEKELQGAPDIFPLLPNTPRVSDVLAWLSTHPNVVLKTTEQTHETNDQTLLQIESFSYALVKRPELSKKQERYQVKIELEFSSPTPKLAREFHDALITPNDFVDPKGEIKWNSNRGKYRTSFFLKDKTIYPLSKG